MTARTIWLRYWPLGRALPEGWRARTRWSKASLPESRDVLDVWCCVHSLLRLRGALSAMAQWPARVGRVRAVGFAPKIRFGW